MGFTGYAGRAPLAEIVKCILAIDQFHDGHHHPTLKPFAEVQLWRVASISNGAMGISVIVFTELD
jgi:hypothetical protein